MNSWLMLSERYIESHSTELIESFIGQEVAWGLHGRE